MAGDRSKIIPLKNKANKAKAKGNLKEAIECYEEILRIEPDDPIIHKEIGNLYEKMGNREKSVEYYWNTMELYIESEFYQNATAIARILLRSGADQLAIKQELAELYKKQGLIGDAVAVYEELAELYKRDGDIAGVFENFKKIIALTPKTVSIRLKLIEIYENQSKINEAIAELNEVRKIYKEQGRVDRVDKIDAKIAILSKKIEKVKVVDSESVVFEQEAAAFKEKGEVGVEPLKEVVEPQPIVSDKEGLLMEKTEEIEEEVSSVEKDLKDLTKEGFVILEEPETEEIEESITGWDDWINLAELYLSVGSEEDAIEYYNKAAEAQFNKKNYEKAYEIYKIISELNPEVLLQRQKMVQSALKLNSREKAINAYVSLYHCLKRKGAKEETANALERARKIDPESPLILEITGEKVKVSKDSDVEKVRTVDFDELFEEEIAIEEGVKEELGKSSDLDALLEQFKKKATEEITGSDYEAHFDLGITYKEMGLIDEAMEAFKKSMKGERWTLKSIEEIAKCLEMQGALEEAERVYQKVILSKKYNEDETVAFAYYLGNIYLIKNDFGKALEEYNKVVHIDPDFADVKEKIELANKGLSGAKVEVEGTSVLSDITEEGSNLWDSVLSNGEEGEKEPDKKTKKEDSGEKKEKDKISYI